MEYKVENVRYRKKEVTVTFDSVSEVLEYIKGVTPENGNYSATFEKPNWCSDSFAVAKEKFEKGWKDGVQRIDAIQAEISGKLDQQDVNAFDIQFDVVGSFIDMGRVMTGDPESFGDVILAPQPKESVTVQVIASYSADVDEDLIYNRGAAICAVIERLRRKYHVVIELIRNVDYDASGLNGFSRCVTIIRTDTTNDFSRDALAFCLANSAYNRRIMFAVNEVAFESTDLTGRGYGSSGEYQRKENAIYFPLLRAHDYRYQSVDSAVKEVEKVLKEFNERTNERTE